VVIQKFRVGSQTKNMNLRSSNENVIVLRIELYYIQIIILKRQQAVECLNLQNLNLKL